MLFYSEGNSVYVWNMHYYMHVRKYIHTHIFIIIIIISDSVDDRDQKPRYGIEVLLNLSRYQVMRELIQNE